MYEDFLIGINETTELIQIIIQTLRLSILNIILSDEE